jgi:hypothetical protein
MPLRTPSKKRIRQFSLFRAFALWVLLTYVCVYGLARDPCLARGGVLTAFVCGTDDGKVYTIVDLVTVARVAMTAVAVAVVVAVAWRLLRRMERASGDE